MDNRLVLVVLFVTLSWISVGINAQSTTAANNMTTAPTLMTNTTVEVLQAKLNRSQCGTQQLCVAEPSMCDPSSESCFFLAVQQRSGQIFEFGLAGTSQGYIAASLSDDEELGGNDTTYVCANDNGTVKFFSTFFDNGRLIEANLSVNSVKGRVNGTNIQCTFAATVPNPTTRASTRTIAISTGSFNSTLSGVDGLGAPSPRFRSSPVNLTDTSANVSNLVTLNTTSSPTTTNMTNATTSSPNTTAATMMTTAAATTTAAPTLMTNTTVEVLQAKLNRSQCGTQQLCVAEPSMCDPSSESCFFLAVQQRSGQIFEFGLAGTSQGYIAASLSDDEELGGNDPTYVCANDNGTVKFFSTFFDNGRLIEANLSVNSVKGRVNGTNIQCTFAATVPNPTTRASTRTIAISTGSFNSTLSGVDGLGAPSPRFRSSPADLTDTSANVSNLVTLKTTSSPTTTNMTTEMADATTTTVMTTSHAVTLQQSLTRALLITAGVLGLAML